jgi:sec-independent protein translocase protein TatB
MFGLSTTEILIILAVALIFVGPSELPKVARTIGKGMAQVRGAMGKVDSEVRRVMREAASEVDDDGEPVAEAPPKTHPEPNTTTSPPDKAPPGPAPAHEARDWSSVGKTPISGRVATSVTPPGQSGTGATSAPPSEAAPPSA